MSDNMARSGLALHDGWEFFSREREAWYPARVPGCVHTDLFRNGLIPDPFYGTNENDLQWIEREDWSYRCVVKVDERTLQQKQVELVADGLDTLATIRLNGTVVGTTENMFCTYRFPIRDLLRPGENRLEIDFRNTLDYIAEHEAWQPYRERNDPVGGRSRIRKAQYQYSWDWGPRFVTCGIWRSLRIEAWSGARLDGVRVGQIHRSTGEVELTLMPEIVGDAEGCVLEAELEIDGRRVASFTDGRTVVSTPRLWWPNGQGEQPLYTLRAVLRDRNGQEIDRCEKAIGLRTVDLVRENDADGETFYFRVNGRPIFAKGANWIPDHAFITECDRERYRERLTAAVDANMNMLRVWGGGVYEDDAFYELCDELGILVWQDFMFACSLYPGDAEYVALVDAEASDQIRRLRHHACLALWCGNNENEMIGYYADRMRERPSIAADNERLFHRLLPRRVQELDGVTPYWPSSPWTPGSYLADANDGRAGDVHYWKVWHERAPVKSYEALDVRFCSEFGMQSYASPELAATFCPHEALNVFSPVMENHQKNGGGNATMLHYINQRFRHAYSYRALSYLSQLNQAWCMKIGIEYFRHRMPRTMGSLYWQINDCWPVASWSSIEYGGRWKALHFEARRDYAPSLVYLRTEGDVTIGPYNTVHNTIDRYALFTIHDAPTPRGARLRWQLRDVAGRAVGAEETRDVVLEPRQVVHHADVVLDPALDVRKENAVLAARLEDATTGEVLSRQTAVFTVPRFIELSDPRIRAHWQSDAPGKATLTVEAESLALAVQVSFASPEVRPEDNFFDLFPGEPRQITITYPPDASPSLFESMRIFSLWHSYQAPPD